MSFGGRKVRLSNLSSSGKDAWILQMGVCRSEGIKIAPVRERERERGALEGTLDRDTIYHYGKKRKIMDQTTAKSQQRSVFIRNQ